MKNDLIFNSTFFKLRHILLCIGILIINPQFMTGQESQNLTEASNVDHYLDFDFWIGEWTVFNFGTDKIAGHSKIESILNGKAIRENYHTDNKKYVGTSLNKYNPSKNQWEQFWVDNSGLTLMITGNLIDGNMVLTGLTQDEGGDWENKITWSPLSDGTVRQVWEHKRPKVNEWSLLFDGHYIKK